MSFPNPLIGLLAAASLLITGCSRGDLLRKVSQMSIPGGSGSETEKMIVKGIQVGDDIVQLKGRLNDAEIPFSESSNEDGTIIHIWANDQQHLLYKTYVHAIVHVQDSRVTSVDRESIGVGP